MSYSLPDASFFTPVWLAARRFERAVARAAREAPGTLHLTHANCLDGAACDALVRLARGNDTVATLFTEPYDVARTLELVARVAGGDRALVVSDLSVQKGEGERVRALLAVLAKGGWRVTWRDHHARQWDDVDLDAWKKHADVAVDLAGAECGASLVAQALLPKDEFAMALAARVRDHDLWLRKDPRSIPLHDACKRAGSVAFVERLVATRDLDDPQIRRWSNEEAFEKSRAIAWGVERAKLVKGKRATIGLAYGRIPTNETLHALEEEGADLSILFKPDGTFSVRSRKGCDVAHVVAQQWGGGGHPNAAGGKLRLHPAQWPTFWASGALHSAAQKVAAFAIETADAALKGG
ncbi:MAG: DHH family phosphoesterase [Thermoplasmatota archaeon]